MKRTLTALFLVPFLALSVGCASWPKAKVETVLKQVKSHEQELYDAMVIDGLTPEVHAKIVLYLENALLLNDSDTRGQLLRNILEALNELKVLDSVDADNLIKQILDLLSNVLDEQ